MPTLYGTLRSLRRWPITAQDGIQELVAQHAVLDGTPAHAALDPVPCLLQHVTGRRIRGEGHGVQFFQVVGGKSEAGEPCECACCVAATPARLAEPVTDLRRAMLYVVSEDCAHRTNRYFVGCDRENGLGGPTASERDKPADIVDRVGMGEPLAQSQPHSSIVRQASSVASVPRNDRTPHDPKSSCIACADELRAPIICHSGRRSIPSRLPRIAGECANIEHAIRRVRRDSRTTPAHRRAMTLASHFECRKLTS